MDVININKNKFPDALIILGMHRSGTSIVMRVCNLLGVDIGDNLLESQSHYSFAYCASSKDLAHYY